MSVPYSYAQYTGNGATTTFSVPFPYLLKAHVKVYLGFNILDGTYTSLLVDGTDYTWTSSTQIQTTVAPANGVKLTVLRQTPNLLPLVPWQDGSNLVADDLNTSDLQNLYVVQEQQDRNAAGIQESIDAAADATTAIATANTALSNSSTALSNSSTALSNSTTALSNSSTALSNSSTALSNSSTALSNSSSAVSTANAAASDAAGAVTTAGLADAKADAAISAVASSVAYTPVPNVAGIPGSPGNNTYIEIADSTGLQSFTPLAGVPAGFVGDAGLTVRLRYTTSGATWNWLNYYANDADNRFLKKSGGTMSGAITLSGAPTVDLHAATKLYVDGKASALQSDVNAAASAASAAQGTANTALSNAATAQGTANAALPKAGGTMTGDITFAGTQTFPAGGLPSGSTSAAGILQLEDSTSSTSTSKAATPNAVKSAYDLALVVSSTANAAMPKAGGTFSGNVTFAGTQTFPGTLPLTGGTLTGDLAVPSLNGGPLAGARNRIINGDMRIDQRNAGASVTVNTGSQTFCVDRWWGQGTASAGVFTLQRSTTAPAGFTNSLLATVTTADSSLASTDLYDLSHNIEGLNVADLAWGTAGAKSITLSFWVRSSIAGTFGGSISNSAANRSYPFTYTISSANTFEYKTIVIAGDTSGTWLSDNGIGLRLYWGLGLGSTYSGTAGVWAGAFYVSATGATNLMAANGATFYITGVQLEAGTVATPFEHRSYGHELALCQRYFETVSGYVRSSNLGFSWPWAVRKRSDPTLGTPGFSNGTGATFGTLPIPGQATGGNPQGTWGFIQNTSNSADSYFVMTASAEL